MPLDTFTLRGSVCTNNYVPKLALSRYLLGKVTVGFGTSCFFLFLELRVIAFISYVNIYEHQSISNAYIKNKSLDVLVKQNRKRKTD